MIATAATSAEVAPYKSAAACTAPARAWLNVVVREILCICTVINCT